MISAGKEAAYSQSLHAGQLSIDDDPATFIRLLFVGLLSIELLLVSSFLFSQFFLTSQTILRIFNLDGEQNAGSWFSAIQLFMIGVLLLAVSRHAAGDRWPASWVFLAAGVGFVFLSADEALSLHESITRFANNRASWLVLFPDKHGGWIPVYLLLGVALAALTARSALLMLRMHRRQTLLALSGTGVFVTGAVLVEIAGYYALFSSKVAQVAIEEFLEMFGASLILVACAELVAKLVRLVPREHAGR